MLGNVSRVARSSTRTRAFVVAVAVAAAASAYAQGVVTAPEVPSGWIDKTAVQSRHFMVAAANPLATQAGYDILRAGGSAADATIAMQLVLGLVEPQSSGLGGGAFVLHHEAKSGRLIAYDGRETAPAAATPDRFLGADGRPMAFSDAVVGGRSVGVPGTVKLLETLHRRHGRLAWAKLFEPAIALADNGFAISPRLNTLIASETNWPQARARDYFLTPQGRPRATGTILRNARYAQTLRVLAAQGAKPFYEGAIAADIVRTANEAPRNAGDLVLADLARYDVKVRTPVCGTYRAYRVCGMPLPSSGGTTVLQILKMLEPYDIASMGPASFWSVHFVSEAERLAYADRGVYMADPDFYRPPAGLLDDDYLHARSLLISAHRSLDVAAPGEPARRAARAPQVAWGGDAAAEFPSTSHIVVVDSEGDAVSMTSTIEDQFGSRLMTESGFLLNNELTDFSFVPSENGRPVANRVEPGKRPRSSMAPTIAYDDRGRVAIITGSPGGPAIIDYVVKTLLAIIDWKLDPQAAAALPNFGSLNGPTDLEKDTPVVALEPRLQALGHRTRVSEQTSGVQAIVRAPRGWIGGADPRREGIVLGD
ncbi:MAG TPA: gamma-glutamyltransferase [Casimicrobiaceae bacterium]|nr:gamma-glutamyltransferase [Casimicrobiaceae bacterium]